MYHRLVVAYKKDTKVPKRYDLDPQLGGWANDQRDIHRNKKMTEERKRLLTSIGFVVLDLSTKSRATKNKAPWEEMYQRLIAYKKEYKKTKVPSTYKKDPKLANWVSTQRYAYRNKTMTGERKYLLDSIGFIVPDLPTQNKVTWEEMYKRLVAYKKEHNDTKVSRNYAEDIPLGYWVFKQRCAYRNKTMTEKRKHLLDSIGFIVADLLTKK